MAHVLVALSLAAGLAIGLWWVVAIPPAAYPYLVVFFLVFLDGLLFSMYRLHRGERVWMLLSQRLFLHSAYAFFILFYGAKAERDLLMLATIPLGFSVFLNMLHLFPGEGVDATLVRSTLEEFIPDRAYARQESTPVMRSLEGQLASEPGTGMNPSVAIPGTVTTITVSSTTTASAPEPPAVDAPPAPTLKARRESAPKTSPFEP